MLRLSRTLTSIAAAAALSASAEDSIRIGEYACLTGKEASLGMSSHQGTVLAVDPVNEAGGVLGPRLDLITGDPQSSPGEGSTWVRKLIPRDHVVAVLGEVASSRSLEAAP